VRGAEETASRRFAYLHRGLIQIRRRMMRRGYLLTLAVTVSSSPSPARSSRPFRGSRGRKARTSACAPLDSGMRYISREKTSNIDNLLEELARVHANF